jgi:tripartite-type tricarboxylate transporter receptor subunit TctC
MSSFCKALIGGVCLAAAAGLACAQSYPAKTVRVINPFAPGGGVDIVMRPVLEKMSANLQQGFVLDNRPGAAGLIGTELGAKAVPDGYTLLAATTGTVTISPHVYVKAAFDVLRDFAPISNIAHASFVLVVHPALAVSNVRDLVALAKRRPGELTFGSPGFGGINFMGATLFSQLAGIQMTHVPFKGSLPMLTDIMGGHVLLAFDSTQATLPHVRSKRLRALGIAAQKRSPIAPEIPTIAESGGPEYVLNAWYGLLGPAALSREVIAKLHAEAVKALAAPDLRERYSAVGLEPLGNGPEVFAKTLREDFERWGKVTRAANIRIE